MSPLIDYVWPPSFHNLKKKTIALLSSPRLRDISFSTILLHKRQDHEGDISYVTPLPLRANSNIDPGLAVAVQNKLDN